MDIQQQLNEQFDRIWGLIYDTNPKLKKFLENWAGKDCEPKTFNHLVEMQKREILASIFMAKDKQGKYILKEGSLENLLYNTLYWALYEEFEPNKSDKKLSWSQQQQREIWKAEIKLIPETLRNLFLANCFGQTEKNIENLKLINW